MILDFIHFGEFIKEVCVIGSFFNFLRVSEMRDWVFHISHSYIASFLHRPVIFICERLIIHSC